MTTQTIKGMKVVGDTIILHPDAETKVQTDAGVKIPQEDTSYGAGFGDSITDNERAFAACREPIAHFLTYIVARDMVDKWFTVDDPDTEEQDPELDRSIQQAYKKLRYRRKFREALEMSRVFGKALLVVGFNDAKQLTGLQLPRSNGAKLMQVECYPKIRQGDTNQPEKTNDFSTWIKDDNPMSPRYGKPVIYKVNRGYGKYLYVHYTRCVEVGDGISVLDKVWDDMTCGRNIRWGAAQWMYRTGSGFACIGFPAGKTLAQLEEYHNSGAFRNLNSRTALFYVQNSQMENDGMVIDFKGVAGHALDPTPFFKTNVEQIAIATGYPQAKLVGAQAGAVTGSEVNQQEYYKAISRDQEDTEDVHRWFIDRLAESGQLTLIKISSDGKTRTEVDYRESDYRHKTADEYVINWKSAFELSEVDESDIRLKNSQAAVNDLEYMKIDEVRKEHKPNPLKPLPNGEGDKLKSEMFSISGESWTVQQNKGNKQNVNKPKNEANPNGSDGHHGSG